MSPDLSFACEQGLTLDDILFQLNEGVILCDPDERIVGCNAVFSSLYGKNPQAVIGLTATQLHADFHNSVFYASLQRTKTEGLRSYTIGYSNRVNRWMSARSFKVKDGLFALIVHFIDDYELKYGYTRGLDPLTCLDNKFRFDQDIADFALYKKELNFLLIDIAKFGQVNTAFTTEVGDLCLMELAARIKGNNKSCFKAYRLFGNTFLLMTNEPRTKVMEDLKAIRERLSQPFNIHHHSFKLKPRIVFMGLNSFKQQASSIARVLIHAMDHAKKNKLDYHDVDFATVQVNQALLHETTMHNALASKSLSLQYQPIVHKGSKKPLYFEGSIRKKENLSLIHSREIMAWCQEFELIPALDRYAIAHALQDIQSAKKDGVALRLGVNVATRTLNQPEFQQRLEQLLASMPIEPDQLWLEVNNQTNEPLTNFQTMTWLSQKGINIVFDAFCVHTQDIYSLLCSSASFLKVSKEFSAGLTEEKKVLLSKIIKMAGALGVEVLAEGCDCQDTVAFYDEVDFLQGASFRKNEFLHTVIAHAKEVGFHPLESPLV